MGSQGVSLSAGVTNDIAYRYTQNGLPAPNEQSNPSDADQYLPEDIVDIRQSYDSGQMSEKSTAKDAYDAIKGKSSANGDSQNATTGQNLTPEEEKVVQELKVIDAEVHAHEQAHRAAAGDLAGAPSYSYETGPDGQRYAVAGEVSIDVSAEKDPEATIAKMERVRRAAMAPAQPSGADYQVASKAAANEMKARQELAQETQTKGTNVDIKV